MKNINSERRWLRIVAFIGTALTIGGSALILHLGNKPPYNIKVTGLVQDERILKGDVVRGYAAEPANSNRLIGKIEEKISDISRPGLPMHLYELQPQRISFDRKHWFNDEHYDITSDNVSSLDASVKDAINQTLKTDLFAPVFLQTEGDQASVGDVFYSQDRNWCGRISATFAARGIRYTVQHTDRTEEVVNLPLIFKDAYKLRFENK